MEEGDIKAPLYYVMGKKANVENVQRLLSITPCFYGVACNLEEKALIEPLVNDVLKANDPTACGEMAQHAARATGRAVLIVGEGDQLKAVYSTGEEETLCLSNLTSMN